VSGTGKEEETFSQTAMKLGFCVVGLLTSFLMWGLMQERVMTTEYAGGRFQSSNFMVFCSRSFGFFMAFCVTRYTIQAPLKAPFYMYSFTSFSNVMSSWCQLESLKYLSFPTQVLGKSSKLIPVMIMGKILSKKVYQWYEYGVAVTILAGVALFVLAEKADKAASDEKVTTLAGLFIMVGYLTFDSFTSQWQGRLFKEFGMSSYQMMLGVNFFSSSFTLVSLLQDGGLFGSLDFVSENPDCMRDIALFSICGATGSMFIFYTIKTFGPLVFTMIMVTRQLVAIVLSCIFYGHTIQASGMLGAAIVFSAIGYKIWRQQSDKKLAKQRAALEAAQRSDAESEMASLKMSPRS